MYYKNHKLIYIDLKESVSTVQDFDRYYRDTYLIVKYEEEYCVAYISYTSYIDCRSDKDFDNVMLSLYIYKSEQDVPNLIEVKIKDIELYTTILHEKYINIQDKFAFKLKITPTREYKKGLLRIGCSIDDVNILLKRIQEKSLPKNLFKYRNKFNPPAEIYSSNTINSLFNCTYVEPDYIVKTNGYVGAISENYIMIKDSIPVLFNSDGAVKYGIYNEIGRIGATDGKILYVNTKIHKYFLDCLLNLKFDSIQPLRAIVT